MEKLYDAKLIEEKWHKDWKTKGLFTAKMDSKKKKYYVLVMLPYPSGRLHMGHVRNYVIGDIVAHYKRMQGYNVLHPMGWDAFGMPAENAAIKNKIHPAKWTFENIETMKGQFARLGISYDWDREVATCVPEYYKWEQLVFLRMYEKGLIFKKESLVNWCETCQTVLANEQCEGGICWRCDSPVVLKSMNQWFCRLPLYAEELLKDVDGLVGWPERVRTMQRDWIGKSKGTSIRFEIDRSSLKTKPSVDNIEVFTTRPDTLFGATFMSLACEHPLVRELSLGTKQEKAVEEFVKKVAMMDHMKRISGDYEKEGVFTGAYCINPVTGWKMPVYAANFVLMGYGTGAVMAVPTHDQRDFEFAKKYNLPLKVVIQPEGVTLKESEMTEAYVEEGLLINSGEFNGMKNIDAITAITKHLKKIGRGEETVNYKLRDWCISRQRYWGAPIPIIHCDKCGIVPVPEKDLPVELPHDVPLSGSGGSPLAKVESFVNVKCPKCKGAAKRETDTMDTFVESSWYFLRYCSPKYDKGPVDPKETKYWMPVDQYIGGIEHAVGHLLYCRFYSKILRDLGFLKFSDTNEPALNLLTQGMVYKDGAKMSKSKGNVVDPDEMINKYGSDTVRLFILFASPPEKDLEWSDQGVEGCYRFLGRIWRMVYSWKWGEEEGGKESPLDTDVKRWLNKTIKKVTDDIERFHFNTAVAAIMEFVNYLYQIDLRKIPKEVIETLIIILAPLVPHIAEELWQELGHKSNVLKEKWPGVDESALKEDVMTIVVQVNGKLRDKIDVAVDTPEGEIKELAKAMERVRPHIEGKAIKKEIYIPGKLINIVVV